MTREAWLNNLAGELAPAFEAVAKPLPGNLRLSCGFPSKGARSRTIGECHYPSNSEGAYTEIFIRPDQAEPIEVGAIVLHELCHAALGPGHGHGKEFKKLATKHGLTGRMTSTVAGPAAIELLTPIVAKLGPYPHTKLTVPRRAFIATAGEGGKRHRNLNCIECGFHAKVWADQMHMGRLVCPVDGEMLLTKEEKELAE